MANLLSVRIAAKRRVDFGEDKKSCKTEIYRDLLEKKTHGIRYIITK
jgi:hypothetical protein